MKWDVSKAKKGTNLYRFYGHKAFDDQTWDKGIAKCLFDFL